MIRKTAEEDLPSIKALMQSIPGFWHEAWTDEALEKALAAAGDMALVYEADGQIVGFTFCHDLGFRAYVSELAVADDMRGRGIGKQLLEEVERILKERGCELIIVDAWKSALPFYKALGWTEPDVVLLRKQLASP